MIVRRVSYFTFIVAITTLASVGACSQAKAMAAHAVNGNEPVFEHSEGIVVCTTGLERVLKEKGLATGTYKITPDLSDNKGAVKIYLVISKDYKGQVTAKIFKGENRHDHFSGRPTGKTGPLLALAADFTPDKRTDIARKNLILLE